MAAAVYMRIFLEDTKLEADDLQQGLICEPQDLESSKKVQEFKKIPSIQDVVSLFRGRLAVYFLQFYSSET